MRIISGLRRGHRFDGPTDRDLRPTSDLVREAIFNILREDVEGAEVLDLFAGTGALGLEALSRGAERALFVERNREHAALIRKNLATLRFEDRGSVLTTDAYRFMKTYVPPDDLPVVVLIDPPWAEFERRDDRLSSALAALVERLKDDSTVVLEAGEELDESTLPDAESWERRRYGGTHLAIYRKARPSIPENPEAEEDSDSP